MQIPISWLQISDLHIYDSTEWNLMLDSYRELGKVVKPDFIVATGDFRHFRKQPKYDNALEFLNQIVHIFGISKCDFFLVPGNHDVNDFEFRKECIRTIRSEIDTNPDIYCEYMQDDNKDLRQSFQDYSEFIKLFYADEISDNRLNNPSDIINFTWRKKINIIILNTALISEGNEQECQIVDIKSLSKIKKNRLPTIVLAHHDIKSIALAQTSLLSTILNNLNTKVYMCGDRHIVQKESLENYHIPNTTIPIIVCGKSAIENGDSYSDVCVIEYTSNEDGNVYVQVYRYGKNGFMKSSDFYYDINKKFNFPMFVSDKKKEQNNNSPKSTKKVNDSNRPMSIWLPDAELANGKQTRFNSFTKTDKAGTFLDSNEGSLGIVSVKGIGKTFLLQVKRVKSSRRYYCLPKCTKPSLQNNWATECISFDSYSKLKTDNIYDNLVLMWKNAIKCYVINQLKNDKNERIIEDYVNNNILSSEVASLFLDNHIENLQSIVSNIIDMNQWHKKIMDDSVHISNLCRIVLRERKKHDSTWKRIAIFIDKTDQAIKQTNAEPPADCVVCKKRNNYSECQSHHKSPDYCTNDNGCKSKNCCYGCEVFSGPKSSDGLRIYENSNAAKLIHINIWQYLQLALMDSAGQIYDEFQGDISVFYTIRQEALNCERYRLGEQNQKRAAKILHLSYSLDEQKKIFLDCIREQDPYYLYAPELLNKSNSEEYAFVGVDKLCHPYCKTKDGTNQNETVYQSIYRHSFDRSRDIQRYGEELTRNIERIRGCVSQHQREELVKQIIEDLASTLAYCSKQSESTVNPSYYTEKMHYLPNYWADNENFEHLLSLIDRNLLFEDDIKCICRKINNKKTCPKEGCKSVKCKRHPFSMLYNMGYLGYIIPNSNNNNKEIQKFLDASEISYFIEADYLMTEDRVAYIVHPALTKTIEKRYNKSFMHFSGFILGKGLEVENETLVELISDRKKMTRSDFETKYYYNPS